MNGKLWGDDIINSLICISISTVQEMFRWKWQTFKISQLPHFVSDLHQIFTVLFKMLYSLLTELTPGAYCIKLLPEKNSGYFNQSFLPMVKSMVKSCLPEFSDFTRVFSLVKVLCNGPLDRISPFRISTVESSFDATEDDHDITSDVYSYCLLTCLF